MNRRWARALLTCAAWLPATAALAIGEPPKVVMKPPPAEGSTAVAPVEVEATTPAELRKQTYSFVDTFAAGTPKLDQIARWSSPLCVTVQGLPNDEGAKIKARVEDVAKALGLRLAGRDCGANLEIKFSNQPQAFLDQVAATHEDMLGYWHHRDRDTLKAVTRSIQAWYRTATIGAGGTRPGWRFSFADRNSPGSSSAPGRHRRQSGHRGNH